MAEMIDMTPACRAVNGLLAVVREDQFDDPTPCENLTVRDMIDHFDVVVDGPGDTAGQDGWRATLAARIDAIGAAWADPAAWRGSTTRGDLELTNEVWGKITLTELVVHGWDLAKATGQPFDLPEPTVRACLDHLVAFVPVAPLPELWGDPVTLPADAPLLDRAVAATGRNPEWTP